MTRRRNRVCLTLACLVASAVGAGAQDVESPGSVLARTLEMPAHSALMRATSAPDAVLAPFVTDGCSGGLSEVWHLVGEQFPEFAAAHEGAPPWELCCVAHDHLYHDAGAARDAKSSYAARLAADRALRACVIETGDARKDEVAVFYGVSSDQVVDAYIMIAGAMFFAVRFGGAPCSGLPWRWGYGYPGCSVLDSTPG